MIMAKVGGKRQAIHGGIKAKVKRGTVNRRSKPKPADDGGMFASVGLVVGQSLDALLDSLVAVGKAAFEFLGKVYNTIFGWCAAVLSWIGDQIKVATGKAKEAFAYVRKLVSSKNVDWIKVHTVAVKALCAAAALGLGVTGGLAVGGTVAGVATAAGASATVTKMVGIMGTAVTAGVLTEACYTFLRAGVNPELIGVARAKALAAA